MKFLSLDSPVMQSLSRVADLMYLNLLAGICCIPIVTIGASMTALHYMSLKLVRDEESYLTRDFFKSFKQNFKQSTIVWMIMLVTFFVIGLDIYIMNGLGEKVHVALRAIVTIVAIFVLLASTFIFPVISKFEYPLLRTIKNAFLISLLQLPKTLLMIVMNVAPWVIIIVSTKWALLSFIFGLSAPAYGGAWLYNRFFQSLEDQMQKVDDTTESFVEEDQEGRIFHDELDGAISMGEQQN